MINDLSELKKLLQLCRKHGVIDIEIGNVKLKLGDLPVEQVQYAEPMDEATDEMVGLTPGFEGLDPMAFYSAPQSDKQ